MKEDFDVGAVEELVSEIQENIGNVMEGGEILSFHKLPKIFAILQHACDFDTSDVSDPAKAKLLLDTAMQVKGYPGYEELDERGKRVLEEHVRPIKDLYCRFIDMIFGWPEKHDFFKDKILKIHKYFDDFLDKFVRETGILIKSQGAALDEIRSEMGRNMTYDGAGSYMNKIKDARMFIMRSFNNFVGKTTAKNSKWLSKQYLFDMSEGQEYDMLTSEDVAQYYDILAFEKVIYPLLGDISSVVVRERGSIEDVLGIMQNYIIAKGDDIDWHVFFAIYDFCMNVRDNHSFVVQESSVIKGVIAEVENIFRVNNLNDKYDAFKQSESVAYELLGDLENNMRSLYSIIDGVRGRSNKPDKFFLNSLMQGIKSIRIDDGKVESMKQGFLYGDDSKVLPVSFSKLSSSIDDLSRLVIESLVKLKKENREVCLQCLAKLIVMHQRFYTVDTPFLLAGIPYKEIDPEINNYHDLVEWAFNKMEQGVVDDCSSLTQEERERLEAGLIREEEEALLAYKRKQEIVEERKKQVREAVNQKIVENNIRRNLDQEIVLDDQHEKTMLQAEREFKKGDFDGCEKIMSSLSDRAKKKYGDRREYLRVGIKSIKDLVTKGDNLPVDFSEDLCDVFLNRLAMLFNSGNSVVRKQENTEIVRNCCLKILDWVGRSSIGDSKKDRIKLIANSVIVDSYHMEGLTNIVMGNLGKMTKAFECLDRAIDHIKNHLCDNVGQEFGDELQMQLNTVSKTYNRVVGLVEKQLEHSIASRVRVKDIMGPRWYNNEKIKGRGPSIAAQKHAEDKEIWKMAQDHAQRSIINFEDIYHKVSGAIDFPYETFSETDSMAKMVTGVSMGIKRRYSTATSQMMVGGMASVGSWQRSMAIQEPLGSMSLA